MRGIRKGEMFVVSSKTFYLFLPNVLYLLTKTFYLFFPNSGSIFRNAVTTNVMRQHAITMMKNF